MLQLVGHLRDAGAATLQFVGFVAGHVTTKQRFDGFAAACRSHDMATLPPLTGSDFDLTAGREGARKLLEARSLPDALVCANDMVALGLLDEFTRAEVRVPGDVMVTGYDDRKPAAELFGLTTVAQPLDELGREVVRLLDSESSVARVVLLTPTIVVRSSTSGSSQG
jgi:LacI family transcriptional regulator